MQMCICKGGGVYLFRLVEVLVLPTSCPQTGDDTEVRRLCLCSPLSSSLPLSSIWGLRLAVELQPLQCKSCSRFEPH